MAELRIIKEPRHTIDLTERRSLVPTFSKPFTSFLPLFAVYQNRAVIHMFEEKT